MTDDRNQFFDRFEALTFDDVVIVPGYSEVLPDSVDTTATFARGIQLAVPLVSAAMDKVTEAPMAVAMAREGGIGVLHRNMSIEEQAAEVQKVKRSQSGMRLFGIPRGNSSARPAFMRNRAPNSDDAPTSSITSCSASAAVIPMSA